MIDQEKSDLPVQLMGLLMEKSLRAQLNKAGNMVDRAAQIGMTIFHAMSTKPDAGDEEGFTLIVAVGLEKSDYVRNKARIQSAVDKFRTELQDIANDCSKYTDGFEVIRPELHN